MKKNLDNDYLVWGVFIDLQAASDTIDLDIFSVDKQTIGLNLSLQIGYKICI